MGEPDLPLAALELPSARRTEKAVEDGGCLPPLVIEEHEWTLFTESGPMLVLRLWTIFASATANLDRNVHLCRRCRRPGDC